MFEIGSTHDLASSNILLAEIGINYFCYGAFDKVDQKINFVRYNTFQKLEFDQMVSSMVDQMKTAQAGKLIVATAFPQALLVPQKFAASATALNQSLFKVPAVKVLQDRIAEWQLLTSYAVPQSLYTALSTSFNMPEFYHTYTSMIRSRQDTVDDSIQINFHTTTFSVLVKKSRAIQLVQTYSYSSPLDVVYYLLKICYEFELSQSDVLLVLSGLVEKDSALYSELQQYFIQLQFASPSDLKVPDSDHPDYYFQSLYNIAACVL